MGLFLCAVPAAGRPWWSHRGSARCPRGRKFPRLESFIHSNFSCAERCQLFRLVGHRRTLQSKRFPYQQLVYLRPWRMLIWMGLSQLGEPADQNRPRSIPGITCSTVHMCFIDHRLGSIVIESLLCSFRHSRCSGNHIGSSSWSSRASPLARLLEVCFVDVVL